MKENKKVKLQIAIILIILLGVVLVAVIINTKGQISGGKAISRIDKEQITKTDFAFKFLKLENNKENMIYSPLSIKYALKLLSEGANGNTKAQIENVMKKENITKYNNINKVLSLANGIYVRDTYAEYVKKDYREIISQKYNAEIKYDSFNNARNINNWIENKTLGIIKNMLRDETVQNEETKMLLINALAIDMEWENPFDSGDTKGKKFYLEDGSDMIANTMYTNESNDNASYYKDENITAVSMDLKKYDDTQLEFVAIMPKENLSKYIEKFSINDFNNIMEKTKLASKAKNGVDITIPRFSFAYDLKLKDDLKKLGVIDAFKSNSANFSKMADSRLFVSDALHKANIDFTEKGIKAAAVTMWLMGMTGIDFEEEEPIIINIDRPFLFIIRDKNTGEIWFVGTVYNPEKREEQKRNFPF